MADLPDRLIAAAYGEDLELEELEALLTEAASRIVLLEWWDQVHKELREKRKTAPASVEP